MPEPVPVATGLPFAADSNGHLGVAKLAVSDQFHQLATQWRAAVGPLSSASKITQHPAYRAIIALGPAAVPLILRELERQPDHWFAALRAITGEDPVAAEDRGRLDLMAAAWLRWGQAHGLC